jgi:hypothetical protein
MALDPSAGAVELIADPATAMVEMSLRVARDDAAAWLERHGITDGSPYVVFSLRAGIDGPAEVAVLRAVMEHLPGAPPAVFLPHCTGDEYDDRTVLADDRWAAVNLHVVEPSVDDFVAVAIIAGATLAVGSRFHLAVLARAAGVPAVAMARDDYDVGRLKALEGDRGVRIVTDMSPSAVVDEVLALVSEPASSNPRIWNRHALIRSLAGCLPRSPSLAPDPLDGSP